jgi:hypothetical protein
MNNKNYRTIEEEIEYYISKGFKRENIHILRNTDFATADLRLDRIRIFVDENDMNKIIDIQNG